MGLAGVILFRNGGTMDQTYQEVYFYLDSQYQYGQGWLSDHDANAFHDEINRLFTGAGWEIRASDLSSASDSALKGKQELYLHPMMVSGVMLPEEIPRVEDVLRGAETLKLRETRTFTNYLDMDDDTYRAHLESRQDEMISAILECYRTKRRDLFIAWDQTGRIAKPFIIPRLESRRQSGDMAEDLIAKLTGDLIAEGRLITATTRHGVGCRTALKSELAPLEGQQAVSGMGSPQ